MNNDEKNNIRVSVVIPNYNHATFIQSAIGSILDQSHKAVDIIVVDDGSTDDSVRYIEEALAGVNGQRRTKLVALPKNVGKLGALNAVKDDVVNPYMLILDADDQLEPDYIGQALKELLAGREEDDNLGFVYSDCSLINIHGEVLDRGYSTAFDAVLLQNKSYIPETALCLSEAYLEVMPFDTSIRVGTKHHKWLRMVKNGWTGKHIPEALFRYRMHQNNISGIGKRVLADIESDFRSERILSGYWVATRS